MKISTLAAVCTLSAIASAFENAGPFFIASSVKELKTSGQFEHFRVDDTILQETADILQDCPADAYLVVTQPGLHASDFEHSDLPHLTSIIESSKSYHEIRHLQGTLDDSLKSYLTDHCNAKVLDVNTESGAFDTYIDTKPRVISLDFAPLPQTDRDEQLRRNDDLIYSVVNRLPSPNYVIVLSAPAGEAPKRTDHNGDEDVKKPEISHTTVAPTHTGLPGNSLFENYQFFTPGIFMTSIVGIFLIIVFVQAIAWLSDLQVSYKAVEARKTD
ncbi:hypothetical protein TRVA0_002S01200 [Trichomonascus vanleenenianus]|uniref:Ac45/VOA1 transmembrane domain-containing protein n=1 Tax=Trichomonascus vanleenenianus TaxID=2268995 RepID=UPI003EC9A1EC